MDKEIQDKYEYIVTNFELNFDDKAFIEKRQEALISHEATAYTREIMDMNNTVETLDRYDDFSSLKISPAQYERVGNSEYGIVRKARQSEAIYPHQQEAALTFLRELRGFGLLADVVGSGKTFEAGVVLSELAVRGRIKTMLVIAPKQVYGAWIEVLEMQFGLGKGALFQIKQSSDLDYLFERNADGFDCPNKPCIITLEDFVKLGAEIQDKLFDVVVLDEAHHLCASEGVYVGAMEYLSRMMEVKKRANKTYCILLSATPHSGNLENMFNLWYFIYCKGGSSRDFKQGIKDHTAAYNEERERYKYKICRGATTVMEFIKKVKLQEVNVKFKPQLLAFSKISENAYDEKTESEKITLVDAFLRENEEIAEKVRKEVASAYHNGVLRSIMVRNPNQALSKKKYLHNFLFLPVEKAPKTVRFVSLYGKTLEVNVANLSTDKAITVIDGKAKEVLSIDDYLVNYENANSPEVKKEKRDMLIKRILTELNVNDGCFEKVGSLNYYLDRLSDMPHEYIPGTVKSVVTNDFIPFDYRSDSDCYRAKMTKLLEILRQHADCRILIFFDYEKKKSKEFIAKVKNDLLKENDIKSRLLEGSVQTKDKLEEEFKKPSNSNAILFMEDVSLTESINLQVSNIIINFEISPDPLSMDQRVGRVFRLGQANDVTIYSLANMRALEGYVLMYFTNIGLMTSSGGDATILAGSNNERMVTIRCPICGHVKLFSQEDYEVEKLRNGKNIYCVETPACIDNDPNGTRMEEISVYDFKCDNDACSATFLRSVSDEGYFCISSHADKGVMQDPHARNSMCNSGNKGDRTYYCRKICAISHCSRFLEGGDMFGKCAALKAYLNNRNISDADLYDLCELCPNKKMCMARGCCVGGKGSFADHINSCAECDRSTCRPRPHKLVFSPDKWEAECPLCKVYGRRGKIRPIQARTFATYIREAWNYVHDKGVAFCANLGKEAIKIAEIKKILEKDDKKN